MGKKSRSESGIREEHPGSYFRELRNNFWVKKNLTLRCGSGSGFRNLFDLDPGSWIQDSQHWKLKLKKCHINIRN
jgi:hypothetical protein